MKPRRGVLLAIATGLCGLQIAAAQRSTTGIQRLPDPCASANSASAVTIRSPKLATPYLSLCDGHAIGGSVSQSGQAQPLALASGDLDEDGTPDLISGFGSGKGGTVTIHRGNVNALWPYGVALRNGPLPAFFPVASVPMRLP